MRVVATAVNLCHIVTCRSPERLHAVSLQSCKYRRLQAPQPTSFHSSFSEALEEEVEDLLRLSA